MAASTTSSDPLAGVAGARESIDEAVARAYQELRVIAHRRLDRLAGRDGTLSTTALVHEAYLKLADQAGSPAYDHPHLLAIASLAMRHVLVDRARERAALKRGGAHRPVTLDEEHLSVAAEPDVLLQLDDALQRLAAFDPRLARVVECRFFGGLTEVETASALGLSARTVQRDWVKARVLLRRALET